VRPKCGQRGPLAGSGPLGAGCQAEVDSTTSLEDRRVILSAVSNDADWGHPGPAGRWQPLVPLGLRRLWPVRGPLKRHTAPDVGMISAMNWWNSRLGYRRLDELVPRRACETECPSIPVP
jgi:hypothetical protein